MFLSRVLIIFLFLVGVPAYAMTVKVTDRAEAGGTIPVAINLDQPLTEGQHLDLLVNGELAAQVKVLKGKLTAFSTRIKGTKSNTTITVRVVANERVIDSISRNIDVGFTVAVDGSPSSARHIKAVAQNGIVKLLISSENGFSGTLILQDTGFLVEISGSSVISRNPYISVNGEFTDQLTAHIAE